MSWTWRHVLYRLHDSTGALLYVGITNDVATRFGEHAAHRPWWPDVAGCTVEFYPDRDTLEQAERDAIRDERPRHNLIRYTVLAVGPGEESEQETRRRRREELRRRREEERALDRVVDGLVEWHNPFVPPEADAEWIPGYPHAHTGCPCDHPHAGDVVILGTWERPFAI